MDKKWESSKKSVLVVAPFFQFTREENKILFPLKKAHRTQGMYWEKAYQAVKHDRYNFLYMGNVKAVLQALAALYLLNIYYKDISWCIKRQEIDNADFSFGSALFALESPVTSENVQDMTAMTYRNIRSPYSLQLTDKDQRYVSQKREEDIKAFFNYWNQQPETKEAEFQAFAGAVTENEAADVMKWINFISQLQYYRLMKKVPSSLPFEERERLLTQTHEWGHVSMRAYSYFQNNQITEDNIQKMIEYTALFMTSEKCNAIPKSGWDSYPRKDAHYDLKILPRESEATQ